MRRIHSICCNFKYLARTVAPHFNKHNSEDQFSLDLLKLLYAHIDIIIQTHHLQLLSLAVRNKVPQTAIAAAARFTERQ